jgi:hypothetical protein
MKKIRRAAMERDKVTRRENRRGRDWSRERLVRKGMEEDRSCRGRET